MVTIFYTIMLAFSLVLSIAYIFLWRKHFDVHITLVYALIPVANLGYLLYSKAESYEAALMAQKIIYIGGCYLLLIIMHN
jgi:putative two-component system response regulator